MINFWIVVRSRLEGPLRTPTVESVKKWNCISESKSMIRVGWVGNNEEEWRVLCRVLNYVFLERNQYATNS